MDIEYKWISLQGKNGHHLLVSSLIQEKVRGRGKGGNIIVTLASYQVHFIEFHG